MEAITFRGLPIIDKDYIAPLTERRLYLGEWTAGNVYLFAHAFVAVDGDPEQMDSYKYQIGFVDDDHLVTCELAIYEAVIEFVSRKDFMSPQLQPVRDHFELYFKGMDRIPVWGFKEFYDLLESRTPRLLTGPNKAGHLKSGEKRWVAINPKGAIVYGPREEYFKY